MKVIHVTSSYPRFPEDGTAPFIRSFVEEQMGMGYEVVVLAPYDPEIKEATQEEFVTRFRYVRPDSLHIMGHAKSLRADIRLHPLAYLLIPLYLLVGTVHLFRLARREKPDILHVHWVLPNGPIAAVVARLLNIPLAISLHGSDIYIANKNKLFRWIAKWAFSTASTISACSEDLKQRALKTGTEEEIIVAPWGVDPGIFEYVQERGKRLRGTTGAKASRTVVGLGRMVHKKGFQHLVEAMPAVLERFPSTQFIIGGDGPIREDLRQTAEALGVSNQLQLPGNIPWNKVPDFLANADIFVLPSVRDAHGNMDGLPTVMLEAMSTGLPVIASDIGGIGMVIQQLHNGIKISPGDSRELGEKIIDLLANPDMAIAIGDMARREVEAQFTWRHVAEHFDRLYREAIKHHPREPEILDLSD